MQPSPFHDEFEVPQKPGPASRVTVDRIATANRQQLVFKTDQSLSSDSNRAFSVWLAIEAYARARGYQMPARAASKTTVTATYDPGLHSYVLCQRVAGEIRGNPAYQTALSSACIAKDQINAKIMRLVELTAHLKKALEEEAKRQIDLVRRELQRETLTLAERIDLPECITPEDMDRKAYLPAMDQVRVEWYHRFTQVDELPTQADLDRMLAIVSAARPSGQVDDPRDSDFAIIE